MINKVFKYNKKYLTFRYHLNRLFNKRILCLQTVCISLTDPLYLITQPMLKNHCLDPIMLFQSVRSFTYLFHRILPQAFLLLY